MQLLTLGAHFIAPGIDPFTPYIALRQQGRTLLCVDEHSSKRRLFLRARLLVGDGVALLLLPHLMQLIMDTLTTSLLLFISHLAGAQIGEPYATLTRQLAHPSMRVIARCLEFR